MERVIVFRNKMDEVTRIAAFIDSLGEELELSFATVSKLQLAIEEAVANVIMYAYPSDQEGSATLRAAADGDRLTFTLSDTGTPFDPTAKADPDLNLDVSERPIGGLGIMLVKKIMSDVAYTYTDGSNILTMTINI
ncbi:MAG: ATP-binding protein [Bacteroidaceae bacterium]|nr:ATP-binding protein [Bacteroidaceae bacterium]